MTSEPQHRSARVLWMAVFYAWALTLIGLAVADYHRYAGLITGLGVTLVLSVGSLWILLWPPTGPKHTRTR